MKQTRNSLFRTIKIEHEKSLLESSFPIIFLGFWVWSVKLYMRKREEREKKRDEEVSDMKMAKVEREVFAYKDCMNGWMCVRVECKRRNLGDWKWELDEIDDLISGIDIHVLNWLSSDSSGLAG